MKEKIKERRERRKKRVRKNIFGTPNRPRLCVNRTLNNFHAQLIDDIAEETLLGVSTLSDEFYEKYDRGDNKKAAAILGEILAEKAKQEGIEKVKFDRGQYTYHGRVKAFADSARENGLEF